MVNGAEKLTLFHPPLTRCMLPTKLKLLPSSENYNCGGNASSGADPERDQETCEPSLPMLRDCTAGSVALSRAMAWRV